MTSGYVNCCKCGMPIQSWKYRQHLADHENKPIDPQLYRYFEEKV